MIGQSLLCPLNIPARTYNELKEQCFKCPMKYEGCITGFNIYQENKLKGRRENEKDYKVDSRK